MNNSNHIENNCNHSRPSTNPHFGTTAIHAGQDPKQWSSLAIIPPISLSTTFQQPSPAKPVEFEYSRSGNPTRKCLEECLAALEGAKYGKHDGLTFSSGLAATVSVTHLLKAGDHIVCGDDVYGGTNRYFRTCASELGIEVTFVDARNTDNVKKAIKENTRMVWMETPTNPTMKLCDIEEIADHVKQLSNVFLVVDNTFMSSYFQQPLALGADISMHSLTKYMNGHADVIMGAIMTNREDLYERLKYLQNSLGTVPSPFDCFLVNRGLKTLHVRMEQHMKNGLEVAKFLEKHDMVRKVLHPGLKSHPQHELALRQCSGFSGMVSFSINGGLKEAKTFIKSLKLFILAESLGGIESLVEIPSIMTHASVPAEHRKALGIDDGFIRLSVGIEETQDLIEDLKQALDEAKKLHSQTSLIS
ncbi:cystathionine gamma-lyase-like protein [Dinothrombium tinctorium]|uniref:cystathionine gamma-lyase n=1 Tax=Dinothrombium tinctorium TaxID=1965070 RepID=A0A443QSY8_9ACAR|nr:cystathionine gamma-lyase-like protein [Dinothrombium tinctorium]